MDTGDAVFHIVFSPRGDWIAANGLAGIMHLWDPKLGSKLGEYRVHSQQIVGMAVSQDGKSIVVGTENGELVVWDVESRQVKGLMLGHERLVSSVAISSDNKVASASDDGTAKIWNLDSRQLEKTLPGDGHPIEGVAFSPDGKLLATGNSKFRLWDVETWRMTELERHIGYSIAFSPDGNTLATGGIDSQVILWQVGRNLAGGPVATRKKSLTGHSRPVSALAFSPDGQTLVSGSTDNTVMLWDVASGEPRATFTEHERVVHCVAFSPDGRTLASCSSEPNISIFCRRAASPEEVQATKW